MKWRRFVATFSLLATAMLAGQNESVRIAQPDPSQLIGVWRGQMDGLPWVSFVVTDEGGSLSAAALFYFHMRKTVNDPWTSTPGLPEPMFGLHFDGKTLDFEVSHRRAHPPRTLHDPPVHFRFTLTGPNTAALVNETEGQGVPLVIERSDY